MRFIRRSIKRYFNLNEIKHNRKKQILITVGVCITSFVLGIILLIINDQYDSKYEALITNIFSILSSSTSAGMILLTGIQILLSIDDRNSANRPRLKIFVLTKDDAFIDATTGEFNINRKGKHDYTFCTNLGQKNRAFQYYGICRKEDYTKIIIPKKKGKYGDLFWINSQALKYVYPYMKYPEYNPNWIFKTLNPGEVSEEYEISLTDAKNKLKENGKINDVYILYIDSTGYIFKELVHMNPRKNKC